MTKKLNLTGRALAALTMAQMALFATPVIANADGAAAIQGAEDIADTILAFLTGPIATAAGAIAIAFVGYRWFSGRMELGRAVATVAGIVLVIGSVQIVEFIRAGSGLEDAQAIG